MNTHFFKGIFCESQKSKTYFAGFVVPEAKSQKQEASQKPEAKSQKPKAKSQKPKARSQKPEAKNKKNGPPLNIVELVAARGPKSDGFRAQSVSSVSGFFPFQVLSVSGLLFSYPVSFRFKSFFCFGLFLPCPAFFPLEVFTASRNVSSSSSSIGNSSALGNSSAWDASSSSSSQSSSVQRIYISGKCLRNSSSSVGAIFSPPPRDHNVKMCSRYPPNVSSKEESPPITNNDVQVLETNPGKKMNSTI